MSDSITKFVQCVNSNGVIDHYEVTFSFGAVSLSPFMSTTITIQVSDLQNANDLNEVKTVACTKATQFKSIYAYQLGLVYTQHPELTGSVSL